MTTYAVQTGTPVHLGGEVWSTGSATSLNDGGDVAVYIPTSGYQYVNVVIHYDGSLTSTNSYTQFHNNQGNRVSMEYCYRGYDVNQNTFNYQGGNDGWQLFAQSQDCSQGWLLNAIIPVGPDFTQRPQVQIDMVYTRNGIGVARLHGGASYTGGYPLERVGVNIDGDGVVDSMYWKVIGYK